MSMKTLAVIPELCWGPDVPPLAPAAAERLAARFRALADPTRVAIVNRLAQAEETCVCDLTAAFDLSQPTISHHLKVLREAGLVESSRRGTWAYYRLVPQAGRAPRGGPGGGPNPPSSSWRKPARRRWGRGPSSGLAGPPPPPGPPPPAE